MIYDIDKEVMHSIIRLFADDTKMSAKIETEEDIEKLQQDLEKVYNSTPRRRVSEKYIGFFS